MNKPNKECELRMSGEDVKEAIELWLNKRQTVTNLEAVSVHKTRSRKYFLVARFK